MQDDFGKRLMTVMLYRGMDCKTLSERTFITEVSIGRFCKGERFPKAPELINICQALDVPLEFFDKPIGEWNADVRLVNGKVMRIDETAVIHAKWIHHTGMNSECSNCGSFFPVTEFKQRPFKVNHCINCGARMDLEPEELKPIIKAKWETGFTFPDGEYWKCTNCKEIIKVRAGAMNFCGHCGAQMEREK